jgi:hypothetical protein
MHGMRTLTLTVSLVASVAALAATSGLSQRPADAATPTKTTVGPDRDLAGAIGVAAMIALQGTTLPDADPTCLEAAVDATAPEVQAAAAVLAADPLSWHDTAAEYRLPLITAYLDCSDYADVLFTLALGTIGSFDAAPCIAEAWNGVLTANDIAASLAYGIGLDDLRPAVVSRLVDIVVLCLPDERWWIDDIAIELQRIHDLTAEQATCVATNFVRTLGLAHAVERRVLTIPMLALSPADHAAVDLASCAATVVLPVLPTETVNDCLRLDPDAWEWKAATCAGPHDREVIAVVDLTATVPEWPGGIVLYEHATVACRAAAEAAAASLDVSFRFYSHPPTRTAWERGWRSVICTVGPVDEGEWATTFLVPLPTSTVPG